MLRFLLGLPLKPNPVEIVEQAIDDAHKGQDDRQQRHEAAATKLQKLAHDSIEAFRHEGVGC